jgi:thiol-disulfide isomerase/thioredoxin
MLRLVINIFLLLCCSVQLSAQKLISNDSAFDIAKLREFRLLNKEGKLSKLSCTNSPLSLFVFLSPECPLCKNYSLVLNQLQNDYKDQIKIYGIIPGKAYSLEIVGQFGKDYKIVFPLYIDKQKKLTSYLKATVTPEVVLMNGNGQVIYGGAIDDWVTELGKKKLKASNEYLKLAVLQYTHQQPVSIKRIAPKGCLINEY